VPFTFAHPAAAVPLLRPLAQWGVLSALVIGSIAPDFSYFLPAGVRRSQSHSLGGLLWFCVPAGLVAYWLFHHLLARPLVDLLPATLRARLRPLLDAHTPAAFRAVLVSVFVGAATHIAWDAFTHAGAPIVRVSRALRFHLITYSGYPLSVYGVLQHLSTLLGMALVAYWVWRWVRRSDGSRAPAPDLLTPAWRAAAIAAVLSVAVTLFLQSKGMRPMHESTLRGLQFFLRRAVPSGITSLSAALLLYAGIWQLAARLQRGAR
jgi:hypothetical protein